MLVSAVVWWVCATVGATKAPALPQVAKDVRKAWAKNYPQERIEKVDPAGPVSQEKGRTRVPLVLTVARQNGTMGAYGVTAEYNAKGRGFAFWSLAVGEVKELPPKLPKPVELKALVRAALLASGAKGQPDAIELGSSEFSAEGERQSYRFDGKYILVGDAGKQPCNGMMVTVARDGTAKPWAAEVLTPGICK